LPLPSGLILRYKQPVPGRLASLFGRYDKLAYAAFAVWCTCYVGSLFYGYMLVQTGGIWSAPLDDVFIHFDYARSFARGSAFQWSEGNGYSSGNTSLLYPVVLAAGYWLGFRKLQLAVWAAMVALISLVLFFVWVGRAIDVCDLGTWRKYLIPIAVLSMGGLDWTLFSGMENALHLGLWGACFALAVEARSAKRFASRKRLSIALGVCGALLVAVRPESGVCVALFGFFVALPALRSGASRRRRWGRMATLLLAIGLPGVALLTLQALANLTFTGELSANGAIAKLFLNDPYMSLAEKWARFTWLLDYIVPRLVHHHFSASRPFGWLVVILGLLPLASRRTRAVALLLWLNIVLWMLVVALNNQLRWHNERYAMPAVAWLLIAAAVGLGSLFDRGSARSLPHAMWRKIWLARVPLAIGLCALYWTHQAPRMRDQIWFYGRACRNILDQHITAGHVIKQLAARRVLVGDAGAMTYIADRPGLDLIGLGGYHDYPFARSAVHGLGASIELIEQMPTDERPDIMALYPSWWGELPTLFGRFLVAIPVEGNVICGGAEKVIYRADWRALERRARPSSLRPGERIVDELDIANLLSERSHGYRFPRPGAGHVRYRVLRRSDGDNRERFDAGRIIPPGRQERARLRSPGRGGRLIARFAPELPVAIEVKANGQTVGTLRAEPSGVHWQEVSLSLPDDMPATFEIVLEPKHHAAVNYHLWVVDASSQ
jgi:hypothetical protein